MHWSFAEATLIRSAAFIQLGVAVLGFFAPIKTLAVWGFPLNEPATFLRFTLLAYGALGLALLRALSNREQGRLLVETTGLIKLSLFFVVMVDSIVRRLPMHALVAAALDLILGAALFRIARR